MRTQAGRQPLMGLKIREHSDVFIRWRSGRTNQALFNVSVCPSRLFDQKWKEKGFGLVANLPNFLNTKRLKVCVMLPTRRHDTRHQKVLLWPLTHKSSLQSSSRPNLLHCNCNLLSWTIPGTFIRGFILCSFIRRSSEVWTRHRQIHFHF